MYVPINIPPGVVKLGTDYKGKGRWIDSSMVRWHEGSMRTVGGWAILTNATSSAIAGPVRGMLAYRRNTGQARVIFGTHNKLYDYTGGTLTTITPTGFTAGVVQATGSYYAPTEANTWSFDMFGEDPIGCAWSDGKLYHWDSSAGGAATQLANSPEYCVGVVVTPEGFVTALGGDQDGTTGGNLKNVAWADQRSLSVWAPTTTNQAGDFTLSGEGNIMAGRAGRQETLIWTDIDLFAMRYIGGDLIYAFHKVGSQCGPISRRSMVTFGGKAVWMGRESFYIYNGSVEKISCPMANTIFSSLNQDQRSQVAAMILTDFNEIWWFYPSTTNDNDNAVVYNYAENHWRTEAIDRSAGIDRGVLEYPLMADPSGAIYEHEQASTYADEGGSPSFTPYAETGPIELGNGDQVMAIQQFIPDENTLGANTFKIFSRFYPTASETDNGFITLANPTDVRITARQIRLRVQPQNPAARWGSQRLKAEPGGNR